MSTYPSLRRARDNAACMLLSRVVVQSGVDNKPIVPMPHLGALTHESSGLARIDCVSYRLAPCFSLQRGFL
jgi:hypothetical protein